MRAKFHTYQSLKLFCLLLLAAGTVSGNDHLRLVRAVAEQDSEAVRTLLAEGLDVNAAEADGATALHWAAHWSDLETAASLISAGAGVNAPNDLGVTPLSLACVNRSTAFVNLLLAAGADPNLPKWTGETPLMNCARTGASEAVKLLLSHGADPNSRENTHGQTALMWALAKRHPGVAQTLIERGADIHARSNGGFTPLMFAAQQGDIESAKALLAAGAELEASTPEYGTILVIAASSAQEEMALLLLDRGADPNAADANGISALHWSVQYGLTSLMGVRYDPDYRVQPRNLHELAKALLARGADPDVRIERSLRRGPDGSQFSMTQATPYFLAAVSADPQMMRILAAGGADTRLKNSEEVTPLMAAAAAICSGSCWSRGGNRDNETAKRAERVALDAVRMAVELGSDVNATNEIGQTAMHQAAFTGADSIVQFLADQGANVDIVDENGETPWSMAAGISPVLRYRGQYGSHQSTADLLLRLGARPRTREEMDTRSNLGRSEVYPDPPSLAPPAAEGK